VRCGGNWKRDYGDSYTGTQGETLDTAKEWPTSYRASSRPYQRLRRRGQRGDFVQVDGPAGGLPKQTGARTGAE